MELAPRSSIFVVAIVESRRREVLADLSPRQNSVSRFHRLVNLVRNDLLMGSVPVAVVTLFE
jgi:hypothetical protein